MSKKVGVHAMDATSDIFLLDLSFLNKLLHKNRPGHSQISVLWDVTSLGLDEEHLTRKLAAKIPINKRPKSRSHYSLTLLASVVNRSVNDVQNACSSQVSEGDISIEIVTVIWPAEISPKTNRTQVKAYLLVSTG